MESKTEQAEGVLRSVLTAIQVPHGKYEEAREHYNGVAGWLDAKDSPLRKHEILVFPQGSFAHQTAVRPINGTEYDVDVVCLLRNNYSELTPRALKQLVGQRLQQVGSPYRNKLDPAGGGRRCWTIRYAGEKNFHLDILPARPEEVEGRFPEEQWKRAIRATDKTKFEEPDPWTYSNPQGFAEWFAEAGDFRLPRNVIDGHVKVEAQADPFPERKGLKPVRAAVQILKHDRDIVYGTHPDKPISVIITRLAGELGRGANSIGEVLERIADLKEVEKVVRKVNGRWEVNNPAHPRENFADKWNEAEAKAIVFFEWQRRICEIWKELTVPYRKSNAGKYVMQWLGGNRQKEGRSICAIWGLGGIATAGASAGSNAGGWEPKRTPVKSSGTGA